MMLTNTLYKGSIIIFLLIGIELNIVEAAACTIKPDSEVCLVRIDCVSIIDWNVGSSLESNYNRQCILIPNDANLSILVELHFHSDAQAEIKYEKKRKYNDGYYSYSTYENEYESHFLEKITKMVLTTGFSDHSIPTLPELKNLKELVLSKNRLSVAKLWNKNYLKSLIHLDYSNNFITHIQNEEISSHHNYYNNNAGPNIFDQLLKLNLSHNEISNLTKHYFKYQFKLETLDLSHNKIINVGLLVFSQLEQLKELHLSCNEINDLTFLLSTTSILQKLYLGNNKIQTIDGNNFKQMRNLKVLDLQLNLITNLDEAMFIFTPLLESLYLNNNMLQVINNNTFSSLANLEILDFTQNRIQMIEPNLFKNKNITFFGIKGNYIEGALEANSFNGLGSVTELDLSFQNIDEIRDLAFVGCNELTSLLLNNNNLRILKYNAFKGLAKLNSLDLSRNVLTQINFNTEHLLKLVTLNLRSNNIMNSMNESSFKGLRVLKVLDLSDNNITTIKPFSFQHLYNLTELKLTNNRMYGSLQKNIFAGLNSISKINLAYHFLQSIETNSFDGMNALKEINLSHCNITKIDYDAFNGSNDKLEALDMSYNKITAFKINMAKITNLTSLLLNNNDIMALENESFKELTKIQVIDLSHNNLHSIGYDTFCALKHISNLNLSSNLNLIFNSSLPISLSILDLSTTQANVNFDIQDSALSFVSLSECLISTGNLQNMKLLFLTELEDICLSNNKVTKVNVGMFENTKLRMLDLSYNKINYIQPAAFNYTPTLSHLNVSHNELSGLTYGIFKNLEKLTCLDVSYNKIETVKSEMFIQLESLTVLIADHNRINHLEPNEFDGTKLKSLSIGGNALPCETILELQSHHTLTINAIYLDHTSENMNGITCNVPINIDNTNTIKSSYSHGNATIPNELLENIRDILVNISNIKPQTKENIQEDNLMKQFVNFSESNINLSENMLNWTIDVKNMLSTENKNNHEELLNATSSNELYYLSMLQGINRTNLLLEKLFENHHPSIYTTPKTIEKNLDLNVISQQTTQNTGYPIENNDNSIITENQNFKQNISNLEQKISFLMGRFDSFENQINDKNQTVQVAHHEKLNSDNESVNYAKSSVFTEVCVGLLVFGMICYVIFKIYKKRSIVLQSRRTMSTCEITESIGNSNL